MDFILKEASKLEGELIELRRSLHKIPKFDMDESVLIKGVVSYLAIVLNYLK